MRVSEKISYGLASSGLTVVSGMARGIDSASHRGALRAKGRTIAVLGSGIDVPYPPENKTLMNNIANSGCVISEFPLGTPPDKENFPKRNRLVSGLSLGVLVVEAAAESGALITARYALEQGREVFAVPGNITSGNSEGTNALIKNGAVLVQKATDIIEELAPVLKGFIRLKDKVKVYVPLANPGYRLGRAVGVLSREAFVWLGRADSAGPRLPDRQVEGDLALEAEVAYVRVGDLHIAGIPGEMYPELVYGEYQSPAEPNADFPDAPTEPPMMASLPGPRSMIFGLASDEVDYIIPKRQWDNVAPFAYGLAEEQFGEVNSVGAEVAPILMQALRQRVPDASKQ